MPGQTICAEFGHFEDMESVKGALEVIQNHGVSEQLEYCAQLPEWIYTVWKSVLEHVRNDEDIEEGENNRKYHGAE